MINMLFAFKILILCFLIILLYFTDKNDTSAQCHCSSGILQFKHVERNSSACATGKLCFFRCLPSIIMMSRRSTYQTRVPKKIIKSIYTKAKLDGRTWKVSTIPVSILRKFISGCHRPVRVADGPMTARCRFT